MKKSLLKKITTAVIATTVSAVMCFPLSASAYQGTYVNSVCSMIKQYKTVYHPNLTTG